MGHFVVRLEFLASVDKRTMNSARKKSTSPSQYIMENEREVARLEAMLKQRAYQPSTEVVKLSFKAGQRVLDAGCGSAMLARYIADTYPGTRVDACDLSDVRIAQARELRGTKEGRALKHSRWRTRPCTPRRRRQTPSRPLPKSCSPGPAAA